jgi:hypothetical protein
LSRQAAAPAAASEEDGMADQDNKPTAGQQQDPLKAQQDQQRQGFGGDASGDTNPYARGPEPTGTFQAPGQGAPTDQLGQGRQSFGQSTEHDTTFGQGPQQASGGAQGQSGVLGQQPGQAAGQPSSTATGGPNLSEGLKDQKDQI